MPLRKGLGWAPTFVAGFAAGASGTVAVALLLYSGEGLLRSLTLIVAIELGAFGLGLGMSGPPNEWNQAVESLRKRWLASLLAFVAAAGFALAWALFAGFGASPVTQGLGLALLAGLPLYACGRLLKGISTVRMMAGLTGDGALASLGAATGVLVTGLGALSGVGVPSFVLFLLVVLSGAALLQGWVLRPIAESLRTAGGFEAEPAEGSGTAEGLETAEDLETAEGLVTAESPAATDGPKTTRDSGTNEALGTTEGPGKTEEPGTTEGPATGENLDTVEAPDSERSDAFRAAGPEIP